MDEMLDLASETSIHGSCTKCRHKVTHRLSMARKDADAGNVPFSSAAPP
jgi:hypothetical protein